MINWEDSDNLHHYNDNISNKDNTDNSPVGDDNEGDKVIMVDLKLTMIITHIMLIILLRPLLLILLSMTAIVMIDGWLLYYKSW